MAHNTVSTVKKLSFDWINHSTLRASGHIKKTRVTANETAMLAMPTTANFKAAGAAQLDKATEIPTKTGACTMKAP